MTDPPPPSGPPPGWYPDPTTGHGFRWWDGFGWTEQTSERPEQHATGLQPVGEWMSELFQVASRRAGHFFAMIVLLLVPTSLLSGVALYYGVRDAVLVADTDAGTIDFTNPSGSAGWYLLMAVALIGVMVASLLLVLSVVRQTEAAVNGVSEPWSESTLWGLRRLGRGFGVALAVGALLLIAYLVMVVSGLVTPILLLLTLPLWIVASVLIWVRFSLATVAASLAPSGVQSMATSWQLTRSRLWAILGRLFLLMIVSVSLSLVSGIVAAPFTALAGGSNTAIEPGAEEIRFVDLVGDNPAIFAISQLFGAIGNGAAIVIWAVGLALLYRSLSGPTVEIEGVVADDAVERTGDDPSWP